MARAYIGLGSNLGDGILNCKKALDLMGHSPHTEVIEASSFYRTEPVGKKDQGWFINCVAHITTGLEPNGLLSFLLSIEKEMGRERKEKWGPRTIDLDILFYGDTVMKEGSLIIPHPLVQERRFVLIPLVELAPDLVHPVLKKSIIQLLAICPEAGQEVKRVEI